MNSTTTLHYRNIPHDKTKTVSLSNASTCISNTFVKNERKLLKVFLISRLHKLFGELFHTNIQYHKDNLPMESYAMDSKIIQLIIEGIVKTGEYTMEGIANYTRIPFDVIFDAACGNCSQLSITPWARIVDLYIQVRPEIAKTLFDKFLEIKENNCSALSFVLHET